MTADKPQQAQMNMACIPDLPHSNSPSTMALFLLLFCVSHASAVESTLMERTTITVASQQTPPVAAANEPAPPVFIETKTLRKTMVVANEPELPVTAANEPATPITTANEPDSPGPIS